MTYPVIERIELRGGPRGHKAWKVWDTIWCEWLRHHMINPALVCCHGWIERDEDARQVRYLSYQGATVDEDGNLRLSWESDRRTEPRFMQLEAVPSPFPTFPDWVTAAIDTDDGHRR